MTNGSPDTWLSLHCFLRSAPEDVDAFLTEDVAPLLDGLGASGWFFIRYDEGGHHLRLRVRGASEARTASLPKALARLAERVPVTDSVRGQDVRGQAEHAEVRVEPYVPETARYGGPTALPVAEEVFVLSSRVAVCAVREAPRGSARLALAIDLAHASALACGMDRLSAAQWLRRHAASWLWAEDVPLLGPQHIHARVNSVYALQRDTLASRARALRQALEEGTATGAPADWYDGVRQADQALRSASPSVGRPYVWASQLHMLFNRLGLAPDEERAVCRLAARTLLDRGEPASYFPDDHTSPDRQYLERSKFHHGREQDSAPRDVPAREPGLRGRTELPLPAGPFPEADLRTVMNGRVSRRGTLTGPLDAASLGTLLWGAHASGHESVHRFADGGERLMRHRPYPSAGALYTAGLRLIALDVQGLAPGTYQCLPDRRALRYIGPAPDLDDVRSLSSYLSRPDDDPDGIVPDALPVVLGLYVDLGRLRERYGLRALRLGLLEAGHLAQSLLLTATALRLGTTPLGGFRDDLAHEIFGLDDLDQPLQYVLPLGRHPEMPAP
ncbi:thiopeptide-type bacteriocin biosynthesis protein [Streptomyces cyaneofuscatus]|uniref:Thiopeptide-type bacteriocin biosynthesis protein n=1 Tax=Streptomyces cyaneofuscatus TaxID=66883 RepID=A0ABZ1F754_9ACTN|nr:thiopeptide-type bacteriocin biosynthesis protein [Streptomyces cyaneofuscatus]WSB12152.1 thiopeptide-type bacteriocin biosynthesis protein [Streptomyces cyaneofuscatus]WSD44316.1 thiopeptide-type bacteriocin biosynthesis protein [Streptomyces cyaneofuscatus]